MIEDFERCYAAVQSRDERFDGWFFTAVASTGIYCRPSCPAITPKRANVRFFPTAASAQAAGFRACKRCRPDASPGSPEWNQRGDVLARAMRSIADGVVERVGVRGLAAQLGYSERQLHRAMTSELGAGPQAVARAQRAHTARTLIETSALPMTEVAFASGFSSIRSFNETIRGVFASTPTELRRKHGFGSNSSGGLMLRLPYRDPFNPDVFTFLGERAVPGCELFDEGVYRRSLSLCFGPGVVELTPEDGFIRCRLRLEDMRDLQAAVHRCRALLDLDSDPRAIDEHLTANGLDALIGRRRGTRVPGTVDGPELAVRAVLGQQVSVQGARTLAARLVATFGKPMTQPDGGLTHLFPEPTTLADADLQEIGIPRSRQNALRSLCAIVAEGDVVLDRGADRTEAHRRLLTVPGIGNWTASYICMRAFGDPDAFLEGDLGVKKAMRMLGLPDGEREILRQAERWRPWRAYAVRYLWGSIS